MPIIKVLHPALSKLASNTMWIVRLALVRPYTFVVMAVLIAILGGAAIVSMPVDIFPYIDIPVVSVVWSTTACRPRRWKSGSSLSSNGPDHHGQRHRAYRIAVLQRRIAVVHIYFQPNVKIEMAMAQVTAIAQTLLRADAARDVSRRAFSSTTRRASRSCNSACRARP